MRKLLTSSLVALSALSVTACKTKPMYTEGDIHYRVTCLQGGSIECQDNLRQVCEAVGGEVVSIEVTKQRYLSEDLRQNLREEGREAHNVHLTCRPPADTEDEQTS